MSVTAFLRGEVTSAWESGDFDRCLSLLNQTLSLHEMSVTDDSPLPAVAFSLCGLTLNWQRALSSDQWDLARQCMFLRSEILWRAAQADEAFAIAALKALRQQQRWNEAANLIPLVKDWPEFVNIAGEASLSLYISGDETGALSLLGDRLKDKDCRLAFVTELVKIVILTERANGEFLRLVAASQANIALTPWEIVYFCELGLALAQSSALAFELNRMASVQGPKSILRIAQAAIFLDGLDLNEAASLLMKPLDETSPLEWHSTLLARLMRIVDIDVKARQWHALKAQAVERNLPKVALTLSGFVRRYEKLDSLLGFLIRHGDQWDIDIFAQTFDRLGDIVMIEGVPKSLCDYGHGGFYREIKKTRPLRGDAVRSWLAPVVMQVEQRLPDDHYLACLGMEHPQWQGVWEAFCLFDRHRAKSGADYRLVIRGRFENGYDKLDLNRLDLRDDQLVSPVNEVYGSADYRICDRLAVGPVPAMRVYCSIGDGRNFKSLEETDEWTAKNKGFESSHEAHLAQWIKQHGVEILFPEWLTVTL